MRSYQLCFWMIPVWLVFWGQFGYLTGSNRYCSFRLQQICHYMVCFVPLVCVFVVLPFIYFMAYRKVLINVKTTNACFTNAERELLSAVKKKFLQIWLVFVFCWVVNVVDGFIDLKLLFLERGNVYIDENTPDFPHTLHHFGIWVAEAMVNPLQGFLNCLVYRQSKMHQCCLQCCSPSTIFREPAQTPSEPSESFLINSHDALERSPLLQPHTSSSIKRDSHSQNKKQFVAKLLGEPHIT